MRQLTSRYVPQQSQFECLIQGDSTHETGSFDPWTYLGGPVIKMPGGSQPGCVLIFFCWAWHAFIHIHGNGVNDRHSRECNDDLDYGAGLKKVGLRLQEFF